MNLFFEDLVVIHVETELNQLVLVMMVQLSQENLPVLMVPDQPVPMVWLLDALMDLSPSWQDSSHALMVCQGVLMVAKCHVLMELNYQKFWPTLWAEFENINEYEMYMIAQLVHMHTYFAHLLKE